MNKNIFYWSLFILGSFLGMGIQNTQAQSKKIDRAHTEYAQHEYINAQKIYLQVAQKGYESEELLTRLANSYYFNAEYDKALTWYRRLFDFTDGEPTAGLSFLRYAQTLKANGFSKKAEEYYALFLEKSGTSGPKVLTPEDQLKIISENNGRVQISRLKDLYDEEVITYGNTVKDGFLYYTSTQSRTRSFLNRRDAWTNLNFLSLFKVKIDSTYHLMGRPKALKGVFKSRFHSSSPVFTRDGNTVYFTKSSRKKGKSQEDQVLKIWRSHKIEGKWQQPELLSINGDDFSTAHPALSPDEKFLYFSSDRAGGQGQNDLYVAAIDTDGTLGAVKNLGNKINTPGRETFPYVTAKNELYFSSDGHLGLGGLDVFYTQIHKDGSFGHVINVGSPINSHADDFAFSINDQTGYGLVSSNRSEKSDTTFVRDNMYRFIQKQPLIDPYVAEIEGYVTDRDTKEPLSDARIKLTNLEGEVYGVLSTDENGYYHTDSEKYKTYLLAASKEGYDPDEKQSEEGLSTQRIDFALENLALEQGVDLAKGLHIPIIHFDFDKANIRPDAEVELQKVIAVMEEYPKLRINIRSHTDSRGGDAYNLALSQRRAKSTYHYLVAHGIAKDRLTYEGLGETELVNGCSNGVPCTAAQHQENRRSEFIILDNEE